MHVKILASSEFIRGIQRLMTYTLITPSTITTDRSQTSPSRIAEHHDQEQTAKPIPNNEKKKNLKSNNKKIINSQEKGSILKLK
jgi:hypothetical protein